MCRATLNVYRPSMCLDFFICRIRALSRIQNMQQFSDINDSPVNMTISERLLHEWQQFFDIQAAMRVHHVCSSSNTKFCTCKDSVTNVSC